jgi:hypothetical protein
MVWLAKPPDDPSKFNRPGIRTERGELVRQNYLGNFDHARGPVRVLRLRLKLVKTGTMT